MPDVLRYFIWSILSIGMLILAVAFFWVFLIVLAIIITLRIIYMKLFKKDSGIRIYTFSTKNKPHQDTDPFGQKDNRQGDSEYTTVIDADDMEKEYKIPKL